MRQPPRPKIEIPGIQDFCGDIVYLHVNSDDKSFQPAFR